ncbi:MAG: AarF/UbiB family protein [Vulcanimicrobiaceae bacterium]
MASLQRLVLMLGAAGYSMLELRGFQRLSAARRETSAAPSRFVERLIRLGPLYVKSTRPDVLPKQYVTALQKLQEHVPPMASGDVEAVIREEFRSKSISDVFKSFESAPAASASVAQVHFAVLPTGTEVAVKIQRRGVEKLMRSDLSVLATLVAVIGFIAPRVARAFNIRDGFAEFRRYTLQELDFEVEARTMLAFRENFAGWKDVLIPEPFLEYVTKRVLTMERVSGKRVDVIADSLSKEQRTTLGQRLLEIEMKMFISDGLFHADLHPGNIFFQDDGTIVLLDFGMYGSLTEEHRDHFMLYWFYGLQKRTKMSFHHLIAQTTRLAKADEDAYYRLFCTFADRFYGSTITKYSLTQTYLDIITSGARFGFVFPSDLLLQAKALTTAEALAFVLTPDLRFEDEAQPIIAQEFVKRIAEPRRIRRRLEDAIPELLLFGRLPSVRSPEGEGDEGIAGRLWSSVAVAFVGQLPVHAPPVSVVRALIDPTARHILSERFGEDGDSILEIIWTNTETRWAALQSQATLGATITVRLAAVTATAYDTLVMRNVPTETATKTVYDIAWAVYQKMGGVAWATSGALTSDRTERLRLATVAFRTFPFSAPSYQWEEISSSEGVVGFDCLKCPVAEYFKAQNLSDLCVRTWCALDFPLAADVWDGELIRSGSIAGGASRCDFRWHAKALNA